MRPMNDRAEVGRREKMATQKNKTCILQTPVDLLYVRARPVCTTLPFCVFVSAEDNFSTFRAAGCQESGGNRAKSEDRASK